MKRRAFLSLSLSSMFLMGCGDILATPTPKPSTPTPVLPTQPPPTLVPRPTSTPIPSPTATPVLELKSGESIVVGGEVRTRKEPSSQAEAAGYLPDHASIEIAQRVKGENWLVGTQTWVGNVAPGWATEWFKLPDGSFVYGAFVYILVPGEVSPVTPAPAGVEKWINVDIRRQTAYAMVGDKAVFTAPMSSGQAPFKTPAGHFAVEPDGRIAVERMTATQAGYDPSQAQYDVERVLFTQYFDQGGHALHLNYWRPHSVFGKTPTSHGCVGLELHEAQYFWLFAKAGTRVEINE